jgi:hypothetical protein
VLAEHCFLQVRGGERRNGAFRGAFPGRSPSSVFKGDNAASRPWLADDEFFLGGLVGGHAGAPGCSSATDG